ncbi:NBPF family member NBPF8-like [Saimiri boliviensis]|uniref:NBPF family member NBPF8-like n=1 Tax=Saimiri boliviensis TaxID=27679 RepID=UPI003D76F465
MMASGRTCSRKATEVNFPDTIENSYSQQEETKPNFRDSKYRLLMSQVAYFRNYQLKTYKDRKDHNEEQKYRDNKNKLIMSQVAYYLGCRLKTEVPGFLCSARNVNMVASDRPPSRKYTEVNVAESLEKSCPQQEEIKPNVGASKNGLLMSQVAYVLNCRERTYKDRKDHDEEQKRRDSKNKLLMSQVAYYLGCRLKTEVPGFLCSAPNINKVVSGRPTSGKNTEVNISEGIEKSCSQQEDNQLNVGVSKNRCLRSQVNYSVNYQPKTYSDQKDHDEEQTYRDSKNKRISQAAYYPGCWLKTEENDKDVDEDVHVVAAEKIPESPAPREVQKVEIKKVPEDPLEECVVTRSDNYGPTDSSQPHGDTKITFEEENINYALVVESESSHDVAEDALSILSEDRKDHEEDQKYEDNQNKLFMSQAACDLGCQLKTEENDADEDEDVHVVEAEKIPESRAPREVQKVKVKRVPEDSLEECAITPSSSYGLTNSSQPRGDTNEITFEEDSVDSALVEESPSSRDVVEDALIILSERQGDDEEEEEKGPAAPRNPQESVEEEAPQESWDEGYSTLSVPPGTSAFNEPYRSNLHSLEEQQVDLARDVDKIKNDDDKEEDQGPLCPRLSVELVEAEEPEVFWYSLDVLYSTYTAYPEFYYICQDYTYAIFLLVEEHVCLTLDMDSRFLTMTVIRLHLVSRIGVTFPH